MLIQKQYNELVLLEIRAEQKVQQGFSEGKKQFQIFQKKQLKYHDLFKNIILT